MLQAAASLFFLWQGRRKESCHLKVTGAPPGVEGTVSPSSILFMAGRLNVIFQLSASSALPEGKGRAVRDR